MAASTQRRALGEFVRAHRARLTPAALGLPQGARRRTPGLRREEVAQLCGMSATWYTWIEQGRDVAASPAALARLAQVLQLSPAERAYLFELAGRRDPARPAPAAMDAPPALVAALGAIALPAYVLDRTLTARAWNDPAARLFVGWLDGPGTERNLLRYIFLSGAARRLIVDWEERASRVVAEFRADTTRHLDDPAIRALVEGLRAESPAFKRMWDEQAVVDRAGGLRSFAHPDGPRRYEQLTFALTSRPELKLVLLVPLAAAGPESGARKPRKPVRTARSRSA